MADHAFCRQLLKEVMVEVKAKFTKEQIKTAWAIGSNGRYEFHGPDKFFTSFKADCVNAAKAEGWMKLLEQREANHIDLLRDDPLTHATCACPRS